METIVTLADTEPVILQRPLPEGPTISVPQEVKLPDTVRVDSGVEGEQILERTVGMIVKV